MVGNAVQSPKKTIHNFEVALLGFVLLATIAGIIICFVDKKWFENVYTVEDGFIENFTVFPLSIAVIVAIRYIIKLHSYKSWLWIMCMIFAAVFSFFVAGEEISWGQRIFKEQVPEYFKEHNAQGETNLHNLIIDGEKVNKIVFTLLLSIVVGLYLLVLPFFYRKKGKVRQFVNWAGIPIPRALHIVSVLIMYALLALIPDAKNSEILEMGISSIFLLILMYPENKEEAFSIAGVNRKDIN